MRDDRRLLALPLLLPRHLQLTTRSAKSHKPRSAQLRDSAPCPFDPTPLVVGRYRPDLGRTGGGPMRSQNIPRLLLFVTLLLTSFGLVGSKCSIGLNPTAQAELQAAGVDKYLGEFTPVSDRATSATAGPSTPSTPKAATARSASRARPSPSSRVRGPEEAAHLRAGRRRVLAGLLLLQHSGRGSGAPDRTGGRDLGLRLEPGQPVRATTRSCTCRTATARSSRVTTTWSTRTSRSVPSASIVAWRNQSAGMDVAKAEFPDAKKITVWRLERRRRGRRRVLALPRCGSSTATSPT